MTNAAPLVRRLPAGILALLAGLTAPLGSARAQEVTCDIQWAPMRDGTMLATEVYLPAEPGPHPTILTRTPYNRFPGAAAFASNCNSAQMQFLAAHGFVALNQDVRGRYRSEGTMDAMQQEAADGYDAVEWAASQPWSTGKVGMIGGSYVGLTQWQPAIQTPPHLAAIAPQITASDYHDHWTYVNGAFDLWFAQSWMLLTFAGEQVIRNLEDAGLPQDEVFARTAEWIAAGQADILTDWVWRLPLDSFDEYRKTSETDPLYAQPLAPYYYDWLAHPNYDPFWAKLDVETRYANVTVPALNIGWWYDIFQIGTVRNFQGMQADGGTPEALSG